MASVLGTVLSGAIFTTVATAVAGVLFSPVVATVAAITGVAMTAVAVVDCFDTEPPPPQKTKVVHHYWSDVGGYSSCTVTSSGGESSDYAAKKAKADIIETAVTASLWAIVLDAFAQKPSPKCTYTTGDCDVSILNAVRPKKASFWADVENVTFSF
jgi:hypothetical protein